MSAVPVAWWQPLDGSGRKRSWVQVDVPGSQLEYSHHDLNPVRWVIYVTGITVVNVTGSKVGVHMQGIHKMASDC